VGGSGPLGGVFLESGLLCYAGAGTLRLELGSGRRKLLSGCRAFFGGLGVVAKVRTLGAYVARASHGNLWG
jgi:hypothetical protein